MSRYTHKIFFRAFDKDEEIKMDEGQVMDRTRMRREVREISCETAFLLAYEVIDNSTGLSLGKVTLHKDWVDIEERPQKIRPAYVESKEENGKQNEVPPGLAEGLSADPKP